VTWGLLILMIGGFYGIIIPPLEELYQIICGIIFGASTVGAIWAGFMACITDPIDPNVQEALKGNHSPGPHSDKLFCALCRVHVNKSSKHCRYCEKCVDRFDHHCKWLNNCIGAANYRYFIILLVFTFIFTLLELGLFARHISAYFVDKDGFQDSVRDAYGGGSDPMVVLVLCLVFAAALVPVALLLGQLFFFHGMLIHEDLTTYDYIMREQRREREREPSPPRGPLKMGSSKFSASPTKKPSEAPEKIPEKRQPAPVRPQASYKKIQKQEKDEKEAADTGEKQQQQQQPPDGLDSKLVRIGSGDSPRSSPSPTTGSRTPDPDNV